MRIITSSTAMERGKKPSEQHEQPAGLYDEHFGLFLRECNENVVFERALFSPESHLHMCTHGNAGARVAWGRNEALSESWRVAAYHSNRVAELDHFDSSQLEKADGIYVKGNAFRAPLAIRTADCLAVAVTLELGTSIVAASCFHAGWRGYCTAIQRAALEKFQIESARMTQRSKESPQLFVTIGPAVFGASYPCGIDVLEALTTHHNEKLLPSAGWTERHETAFWKATGRNKLEQSGKIYPDLQLLMCIELDALAVSLSNVTLYRENTFASRIWPSHRRSMNNAQPSNERLITHLCPPACPSVTNRDSTP
jgi:polyphenol oxidase